jgi:hypothetical protein
MLYFKHLYCEKFVASGENSKWRRKCLYFALNLFKNGIFVNFYFILFALGKIITFKVWKNFF